MPDSDVLTLGPDLRPGDREAIVEGLVRYNSAHGFPWPGQELHLILRDTAGAVRGGVLGESNAGWLFLKAVWVDESVRACGHGTRLLTAAEDAARGRGCFGVYLDTYSFQARPFYERNGYTLFGQLLDHPPGGAKYYLAKRLDSSRPVAVLPDRIETERLVLRRPRATDAASIFEEYARDPEVTRYMDWQAHQSVAQTHAYLAFVDAGWNTATELTWAVTLRPSDRVVGMIGLRPRGPRADFGYVLGRAYWGQGLMTEAGRAVVAAAFSTPGLYRLWATCDTDNAASAHVLEKLGLTREGTLRGWAPHSNLSPVPRDAFVYGMTRADLARDVR